MILENFLYPAHPVCCIITGPWDCRKSYSLTNLILNIFSEFDKTYIYLPSLHQKLYQKFFRSFSKYIPIHILPKILNEEDIDIVIEELVDKRNFEKSPIEIATYESTEELKFLQEDDDGGNVKLDDINEKKTNDPRVQAPFKRSGHNSLSIFIISQDYY